jgi:hypothetical protein
VFRVLCELNAPRLLDLLVRALDEQGVPSDEHELFAEFCARLQRYYCIRAAAAGEGGVLLFGDGAEAFDGLGSGASIFSTMAVAACALVEERLVLLRAQWLSQIGGLFGGDESHCDAADTGLLIDAARHVQRRRLRLPLRQLERLTTSALFRLDRDQRRILLLRTRRGLGLREIASRTGLAPFEAGLAAARALQALLDQVDALLVSTGLASTNAVAEPVPAERGRLLTFPRAERSNRAGRDQRPGDSAEATLAPRDDGDAE